MGNYISCFGKAPCTRGTKVIFPSGEVRHLYEPTKVAELMLETPNSFIVNARSLQIGKTFSPLNADQDLEISNVYVFFPMNRVNSLVKPADMAAKRSGVRISPESGGDAAAPKLNLEELSTPEFKHRISICRSKKPLLDTILEELVYLS